MDIYQQERAERRGWRFAVLGTALPVVVLISLILSSCTTFEKARLRFAKNVADTTYTTVTTTVPRDSAVLRIVTDTTTVVHEIRQGRARIIYQRDPNITTIKADCDSVVIEKKVPHYITRQVWGVDPKYRDQAHTWRTVAFVLIGLIGAGIVAYVFTYHVKLTVAKRNGAPAA